VDDVLVCLFTLARFPVGDLSAIRFCFQAPYKSKECEPVLGGSHFFSENRRFQFLGQVLRIAPVLFQKISHYENRLDYQKKFKNLVRRFSELAVLTEF
jgi:hypothetical protein